MAGTSASAPSSSCGSAPGRGPAAGGHWGRLVGPPHARGAWQDAQSRACSNRGFRGENKHREWCLH